MNPSGPKNRLEVTNATAIVYARSYDGWLGGTPRKETSLMFAVDESLEDFLPRPVPLFRRGIAPARLAIARSSVGDCLIHHRLDLLLPTSPASDRSPAWQGECGIVVV